MTLFFRRPPNGFGTRHWRCDLCQVETVHFDEAIHPPPLGWVRIPCTLLGAHHLCGKCALGRGAEHTPTGAA